MFVKTLPYLAGLTLLVVGVALLLDRCTGLGEGDGSVEAGVARPVDALLSQRLAIAYGALRDAEGARRLPEAHRYARVAIDAIAGPAGRHGRAEAPPDGILAPDTERLDGDAGLALRAHDAAPESSPLRAAIDGTVTGSVAAWRSPRSRYDAIDRAVAEYRAGHDSVSELPGESERALAWALLVLETENINDAHTIAGHGARAARRSLDAVRIARASGQ